MYHFGDELRQIRSPEIRKFVEAALAAADPRFWTDPCSRTGRHHAPEDNERGGIVTHTVKACAIVKAYGELAGFHYEDMDMALAGMILHDVCKNVKDGVWGESTNYAHGIKTSVWLRQFELPNSTVKRMILDAVRYHMGSYCYLYPPASLNGETPRTFTEPEMMANLQEVRRAMTPNHIEKAVQTADTWASRNEISFIPGVSISFLRALSQRPG